MSKSKYTQKEIRTELINQLETKGLTQSFYMDLVNDYITLWNIEKELVKDVEVRGVSIPYQNGANQKGIKENDSVKNILRVNNQMLKILQELGLRGAEQEGDYDDEL